MQFCKVYLLPAPRALEGAAQGSDGVSIPGSTQELTQCGYGLVDVVGFGRRFGLDGVKGFSQP